MENALQKAKEAKKIKEGLMLSPGPLSAKQLLFVLQKTPKEHIYSRKGKGEKIFDYVTSVYMKKVLNYAFGWMWDFEIKEHGREKEMVWVLGKLTIKDKSGKPMIIKEQFGRSEVKYYKEREKGMLDFGNDLKSAASDALKKCASELGIASDVYGKQEFKEIQKIDKTFSSPEGENGKEATKNEQKSDNLNGLIASETDIERIKTIAREMGLNTIEKIEKKIGLNVSFNGMTKTIASKVYAELLNKQVNK